MRDDRKHNALSPSARTSGNPSAKSQGEHDEDLAPPHTAALAESLRAFGYDLATPSPIWQTTVSSITRVRYAFSFTGLVNSPQSPSRTTATGWTRRR